MRLYFQFSGQDEECFKRTNERRCRKTCTHQVLFLEAIAEAEKIEVTDEEVDAELTKMAEIYNMEVEEIKQALGKLDSC